MAIRGRLNLRQDGRGVFGSERSRLFVLMARPLTASQSPASVRTTHCIDTYIGNVKDVRVILMMMMTMEEVDRWVEPSELRHGPSAFTPASELFPFTFQRFFLSCSIVATKILLIHPSLAVLSYRLPLADDMIARFRGRRKRHAWKHGCRFVSHHNPHLRDKR